MQTPTPKRLSLGQRLRLIKQAITQDAKEELERRRKIEEPYEAELERFLDHAKAVINNSISEDKEPLLVWLPKTSLTNGNHDPTEQGNDGYLQLMAFRTWIHEKELGYVVDRSNPSKGVALRITDEPRG